MFGLRRTRGVPRALGRRGHHPNPGLPSTKGWKAALKEEALPSTKHEEELARGLKYGLPAASSIEDRTISTFSRGELPHFAGLNSFMKAPYGTAARVAALRPRRAR